MTPRGGGFKPCRGLRRECRADHRRSTESHCSAQADGDGNYDDHSAAAARDDDDGNGGRVDDGDDYDSRGRRGPPSRPDDCSNFPPFLRYTLLPYHHHHQ